MFLVSTRCGIIACRYLAGCYYREEWATAPEIADKYRMNVRSLMPALRRLTQFGILKSRVGGKTPGFQFAQDPRSVSMFRVITTLESEMQVPCCKDVISGLECDCGDKEGCSVFGVCNQLLDEARKRLSSISVAEHADLTCMAKAE